ncbi:MAG: hypothetical protein H7301_02315 [Cryobacterium sp.]|nr:hypothetical protein [Oligoflexia bacterium]
MEQSADLKPERLKKYLDRRFVDGEALGNAAVNRDGSEIREISHRIKGNAALYGFADLGLLSGRIVREVERSSVDWIQVENLISDFKNHVRAKLSEIKF